MTDTPVHRTNQRYLTFWFHTVLIIKSKIVYNKGCRLKSYTQKYYFFKLLGLTTKSFDHHLIPMATGENLLYQIALTLIPGVGDIIGRKLVALCGGVEAVFREPRPHLKKMPKVVAFLSEGAGNKEILRRAEQEVRFLERYSIKALWYQDKEYPQRLRHCADSPILLFYKGVADLNATRVLALVGTRRATDYGKSCTRDLVMDLRAQKVLVVSGLAYGIDSCAHRYALEAGLNTIGVLGHGLDRLYPFANRNLAEKMIMQGGLLTEFLSGTKPDRENFPRRNRIIAGMCDAVIVVEAGSRGGALITADIANSYNRDVFAVPGRLSDSLSEGSNFLVKTNRAALIQGASDVEYMMGWRESYQPAEGTQRRILLDLSPEAECLVKILQERGQSGIDDLCADSELSMSKVSTLLLNLEFEGVVKCLPGKLYTLS